MGSCAGLVLALLGAGALRSEAPTGPAGLPLTTVTCVSLAGERQLCAAYTDGGVLLLRSTGAGACLLGRSWGYDAQGVWVTESCGGEFAVAQRPAAPPPPVAAAPAPAARLPGPTAGGASRAETGEASDQSFIEKVEAELEKRQPTERIDTYGVYDPGNGVLLTRGSYGELALSAYAMVRYMNQNDDDQAFTDHLGNVRPVDPRNDIFSHRTMIWLKGWLGSPKFIYNITLWTVNATDQNAIFANLGYQFSRRFSLYAGLVGNPGSRSLLGSHPYWLGHDRVMADEFFRPYFGSGIYAVGELLPGFWYNGVISNSNSALGVKASQLDRKFTTGASVWWMPTTHEFGPRGAYGDWELHDKVATRFGVSYTDSPEQGFRNADGSAGNTTLRLADSLNLFDTGSLAPGVTVNNASFRVLAVDAGLKYKGFFFQVEYFQRWLDDFDADGPLPVRQIVDRGFYVQTAFFPIPKKLELYAVTSQIQGDEDAGFDRSWEYGGGMNYYPFASRNYRLNLQVLDVHRSPVSSTFGYYTGGQSGLTAATSFSILF
jgi:hypothetical protein